MSVRFGSTANILRTSAYGQKRILLRRIMIYPALVAPPVAFVRHGLGDRPDDSRYSDAQ